MIGKSKNTFLDLLSRMFQRNNDEFEAVNLFSNYASDTIYRFSYENMEYVNISPSLQKLIGYGPRELKKIGLRSIVKQIRIISNDKIIHTSFDGMIRDRLQNKSAAKWQCDYLIEAKDSSKIWVSDISYPWYDKSGDLVGSIGCLRDVTERIKAESRTQQELMRIASTDDLTSLANRREFFKRLDLELIRTKRSRNFLSILLIDVDNFKIINDQHGHLVGDVVLVEISNQIKKSIRESDLAARVGGEEFAVFLSDTDIEGAYIVAQRICKNISGNKFKTAAGEISCTVSIGLSSNCNHPSIKPVDLYRDADTNLYLAKSSGRNQVIKNSQILVL